MGGDTEEDEQSLGGSNGAGMREADGRKLERDGRRGEITNRKNLSLVVT